MSLLKVDWTAWKQVLSGFMISFCSMGLANSFGVFQSYYKQHMLSEYSTSTISWIGTTQGFLLNVVGLISGNLYDRGYTKSLLYGGMLLNITGLVTASFARTYGTIFLSYGLVLGFGSGMFYVPSLAMVAGHFSTYRPLAMNISATGGSVGGIVYPVLFPLLVQRLGFAYTCRVFALVNVTLLVTASILIISPHKAALTRKPLFDKAALQGIPFLLLVLSLFFLWLGVDIPFFYLPTFVHVQLGLSDDIGSYLLSAMNASSIFGRLLLGYAAVNLGTLEVWQASIGASCILLYCWAAINSLYAVLPFVILFGFFTGAVISLFSPALLVIAPDPTLTGTRLGIASVLAGFGFLVGPPIAGAIQNNSHGHVGLSAFAGSAYATAFAILSAVYYLHNHKRKTVLHPETG